MEKSRIAYGNLVEGSEGKLTTGMRLYYLHGFEEGGLWWCGLDRINVGVM